MNKDLNVTDSSDAIEDTLKALTTGSSLTKTPYTSSPTNRGDTIIVRLPSPVMNSFSKILSVLRSCCSSVRVFNEVPSAIALRSIDVGGLQSKSP